jgi:hypothetical protein
MEKLKEKLARFMSGRYGMDKLYGLIMGLCLVLLAVEALTKSPVVGAFAWALMIAAIYRSFSRDYEKRSLENEKYLALTKGLRKRLSLGLRKLKGIRSYRYRVCPRCKAVIEMPARRGTRTIVCPRCRAEFQAKITI